MKKIHLNTIGYIALFGLAAALLFHLCSRTNQAMMAIVIKTEFVGEYSFDGNEWHPLETDTKFSSFDGDLLLRGQFADQGRMLVSFYLNHIGVTISVNGEWAFESGRATDDVPEMMCGSNWSGWLPEELNPEDEVEIRLHNPHKYGNAGAYNEFLDSLYWGGEIALTNELKKETEPYRIAGMVIMVVSVALLGVAAGYQVQKLPSAGLLWSMGLMSVFMGGYILIDTIDIEMYSSLIVFNTCVRQCCIMFASLEFVNCMRKILKGKENRIAGVAVTVLGAWNGILLILSLMDIIPVYDTGLYWAIAQGLVCILLLVFSVWECFQKTVNNKIELISGIILLLAILSELLNARMNWWRSGIVVKVMFVLLFVIHLVRAVRIVSHNHRASEKAKELAEELRNSRIVLAMSQIRTHFIFNILTAISGMCEYDPQKADETLIRFSRYLRNNIDIMEEDKLETFSKSLEHLEDYIALEQVRFGEKLGFEKNLETVDFKIPPLVLQPIVENAIKHGILLKQSGGTIKLHTYTKGENVIITITDDGVGFDVENIKNEGSIGLKNVRFRLQQMMNGRMDIESSPGNGTKVTITIPCPQNKLVRGAAECE